MAQVEVIIDSIRHGVPRNIWIVVLKEKRADRYLPIQVSEAQADILAGELQERPDKSTAPSLFLGNITVAESDIKCITIRQDDDTFYANLVFRDKPFEVRCPIGIALALAYRVEAPILVDEATWQKAALTVNWDWPWGVADAVLRLAKPA